MSKSKHKQSFKPRKTLNKTVQVCPTSQEIATMTALFNEDRLLELEALLRTWTVRFPEYAHSWRILGAILKLQERGTEALYALRKVAELLPEDAEAHFQLGNTLLKLEQPDSAVASYHRALELKKDYAEAHCNLGYALAELGQLNQAVESYRRALECKQDHVETYNNLGNVLAELGQYHEAVTNFNRALAFRPDYAEAHCNLGNVLKNLGQPDDAMASFHQALALKPDLVQAHSNLGNVLLDLGQFEDAVICYRRALELNPNFAEAHSNLGYALQNLEQFIDAEASCRRALEINPDFAEAHSNLGNVLLDLGQFEDAVNCYRRALELNPDFAAAHSNLGYALQNLEQLIDAEASCRRALEINPDFAEAHTNLGTILQCRGQLDEAQECFYRSIAIKPALAEAHNGLGCTLKQLGRVSDAKACFRRAYQLGIASARIREALILPIIMGTREEVLESRVEFERNLDELIADGITINDPVKNGAETNFYLAYHGFNDRDLQIKVAKFYEQACPSLLYTAPHCIKPASRTQPKIRIGFLSAFLFRHSVSLGYSGIIETLSLNEQFEVTLISHHPIDNDVYSGFLGKRLHLPYNLELARKILAELELDILVYLDIGMDPLSYFLAFSRLAPAQCVMGGHPVTTGISNMDYYLSYALMEPLDADLHYSEKLIRLPRPLCYFSRQKLPNQLKTRNELGIPENAHIYMCPVKLQKMHPDFDEALTGILQIDEHGIIVLFEDETYAFWKNALLKRFQKTIPQEIQERIIFLPWLKNPDDFISAIASADVILEPFHFGIGTTSSMIFATRKPLITKAGEFLRGRGGTGFCEMLGLTECIAENTESYAQKAVEIAKDKFLQENISTKIQKNDAVFFDNIQPIDDLVNFFVAITDNQQNTLSDKKTSIVKHPPLYVTQPLLPPLEEFIPYLEQIWRNKWLTNSGPFHQQLEQALCNYLGVKYVALFTNGTLALVTALQVLRITGEVITSPYSFVATAHSLLWNGIKPIFVDIDPVTLNLDPDKIEAAITPQTTAIMPVHCYGHPCAVERIQKIADNYGLKVIYDAAHAFGVQYRNSSILNHGDLSILSFHATKVFNTFEGGAIICHDAKTKQRIDHLKNHGFVDEITVAAPGINGKMSEINAAFGLLQLKGINQALQQRKIIDAYYRRVLAGIKGVYCLPDTGENKANYAYFPILVQADYFLSRDALYQKLQDNNIYARRYFYPLISDFPMYRGMPSAAHTNLPIAKKISDQVICLPIFPELTNDRIDFISELIRLS